MIYNFAWWLWRHQKQVWAHWKSFRFFKKLLSLPVVLAYSGIAILLAGICFAASFMRVFENAALWFLRTTKARFRRAGPIGRIVWGPAVLIALGLCAALMVLTLGQAFGQLPIHSTPNA